MDSDTPFFDQWRAVRAHLTINRDPSAALAAIRPFLADQDVCREFFRALDSPVWIDVLARAGLFAEAPRVILNADGHIQSDNWPQSRYLARMAGQAPESVTKILAAIETDNVCVLYDMLQAAVKLPTTHAARLVNVLCKPAGLRRLWHSTDEAAALCARLANENETDASLKLMKALFAAEFECGAEGLLNYGGHRLNAWLKRIVSALVPSRADALCRELCRWLSRAVEAMRDVNTRSNADRSYLWRPAIEEHAQNNDYEFAGVMVGFVRDAIEQAVGGDFLKLDVALDTLGEHPYAVFRRLRIHLINQFAEQCPALARQTMLDLSLLDDYSFKHEYARLIGNRFPMLSREEQRAWLELIRNGPDVSRWSEPAPEKRAQLADYWRWQRLHWIRDHLDGEWKTRYDELNRECHDEAAEFTVWHASSVGAESPITLDELKRGSFGDALEKVRSWQPSEKQFMGPTIEGLAGVFGQYLSSDPEGFSRQAELLADCRPAIVQTYIGKMGEAAKAGRGIDVGAVLRLCDVVMARPTLEEGDRDARALDWMPSEVSDFLHAVCDASRDGSPVYPIGYRRTIWGILEPLTRGRASSRVVQQEEKDPRTYDYLQLGINTPRGRAMLAMFAYVRWVEKHLRPSGDDGAREQIGWHTIPEVRAVLDWQIAPENSSFEALSVIGADVVLLYLIDKDWLEANADRLFDLTRFEREPQKAHGWAAWNAFLLWVRPGVELFRLLKPQFEFAVKHACLPIPYESTDQQPIRHLAEHLVILYARGELSESEDRDLLRRLLSDAIPDTRLHAMNFIGRSVWNNKAVPDAVIRRFMELWDWYWREHGRADVQGENKARRGELFSTWFESRKFPQQWALGQLEQFAQQAPVLVDYQTVKVLAEIAPTDVERATTILDSVVRSDVNDIVIHTCADSAMNILRLALNEPNPTREKALALVDFLGRRGHLEFGTLLGDEAP